MAQRIVIVLYSGHTGGAETVSAGLATELRQKGVDASILFVCDSAEMGQRLDAAGVPWSALNMARGSDVIRHGRRYCQRVTDMGPDAAITATTGFLAGLLYLHGYPGGIVGVEHGRLLNENSLRMLSRTKHRLDRASGSFVLDCQVGVSDVVCSEIMKVSHARCVERIYNGVDVSQFRPKMILDSENQFVIGAAGRLVAGKGFDVLLQAFAMLRKTNRMQVRIAGAGPQKDLIEHMANEIGISERVNLVGHVSDMPTFWNKCDVAVVPSNELIESFGMCAVEAQACGIPVIVTDSGGLPEVVEDKATGTVVPRGDAFALARAIEMYYNDAGIRARQGQKARERTIKLFSMDRMAQEYIKVVESCKRREYH